MYNLANCYHYGLGTRKNRKKAFTLFEQLAEWDEADPNICFYMGLYYQEGIVVPRDYEKAMNWYGMGAFQDDEYCINQLGVMYAKGLGVPKNPAKAMELYKKAAALGDALACANVGWQYETEKAFKDIDKAIKWYRKGAEEGEENSVKRWRGWGFLHLYCETAVKTRCSHGHLKHSQNAEGLHK